MEEIYRYEQSYIDQGTGEPILLLHGLFGNLSNWLSVVEYFKTSHRLIIPRLPIFEGPRENANLHHLVIALHEFVTHHQIEELTLVGNSLGGHLALLYTIEHPEKVKRIVLAGSSGLFENTMGGSFPRVKDYEFIRGKVSDTFFQKSVVTKALLDEVYDTVQSIPQTLRIIGMARSAQKNNLAKSLHRVNVPVLLIWGLQDTITPPEVALHFHDYLVNSELKFIDQCGHVPMMEHPAVFNQHMANFLETNP
jgi:2-hydroxy-6-oxonona-2,4-dienedioate hydrolase